MTSTQTQANAGSATSAKLTMAGAIHQALDTAMEEDRRVVLLGEDIADPAGGIIKITKGLSTKYGVNRVRATPIAEEGFVGAAVGMALAGYLPVVEVMFMDFVMVCLNQLGNHAAKTRYMTGGRMNVPLTIRTHLGLPKNGAQHSQSLEHLLMGVPGLKVAIPSTPLDAMGILLTCIFDEDPCVFIEPFKLLFVSEMVDPTDVPTIDFTKADIKRTGDDVTIVTWGGGVTDSLAAAQELEASGISAEVLDLRFLVPLDLRGILESVSKTKRAVIVHTATRFSGPGAEIAASISEEMFGDLIAPVRRLGASYAPIPPNAVLIEQAFPNVRRIVNTVKNVVGEGPKKAGA